MFFDLKMFIFSFLSINLSFAISTDNWHDSLQLPELKNDYDALSKYYNFTRYGTHGGSWSYNNESRDNPQMVNHILTSACPNHPGCPLKIPERNKAYELARSPHAVMRLRSTNGWKRPANDNTEFTMSPTPDYYSSGYQLSDKYRSSGKLPERVDYSGHIMLGDRIVKTNSDGHPLYDATDNGIAAYYSNLKVNIPDSSKPIWRGISGTGYYRESPYAAGWHLNGLNKTAPTIEVPVTENRGLIVNGKVLKDMFSVKNYFDDSSWSQSSWNEAGIASAEEDNEMLIEDYSNDNNFYGRCDDICKGPGCIRPGGNGITRKYVGRHKKKTKHHGNKFHH